MLLLAEGLFRLDVVLTGDTLRTVVRNFTAGELEMRGGPYGAEGANVVWGEAGVLQPARTALEFSLGPPADRVHVEVTIATMRFAERGTVRVTAQAIVRQT